MIADAYVEAVRAIQANGSLSKLDKRRGVLAIQSKARHELKTVKQERDELLRKMAHSERAIEALEDLNEAWPIRSKTDDYEDRDVRVEPNDVSRLHRLIQAIKAREVYDNRLPDDVCLAPPPPDVVPFVISEDWPRLIGKQEGDFILPFDRCAFEYRFSGRTVIICAAQEEGQSPEGVVFAESKSGTWVVVGPMANDWLEHVRAACVVLEAEVAERKVIRAPHALNVKRQKAGKQPLLDFHVVNLKDRHRAKAGESVPTGHRKRLHFCRGHWRHLEGRKTWIRWCLKGDASLGMVLKEYAL